MFNEFKKFIARGNVMDLAIGVIVGGAFQKIVNSLVNDIITPIISIITGKVDFATLTFSVAGVTIKYGDFITSILNFLITAFAIFLMVKYLNKMHEAFPNMTFDRKSGKFIKKEKKKDVKPEPTTKTCSFCYSEINIKATRCPNCTSQLEEN